MGLCFGFLRLIDERSPYPLVKPNQIASTDGNVVLRGAIGQAPGEQQGRPESCFNPVNASPRRGLHAAILWLSTIVGNLGLMAKPTDLVQGTLDLLILKTISLEPKHGWAIAKRIQQVSQDALQIQQGSLYPALHRLEQQAWIKAEWRLTPKNQRARYYTVTRAGRRRLGAEEAGFLELVAAIGRILRPAEP